MDGRGACGRRGMHGREGGVHGREERAWQERWPLQRTVRILLECTLVYKYLYLPFGVTILHGKFRKYHNEI